jgi:predicted ribonuclease YlaK
LAERLKGLDLFGHIILTKGERSRLAELASGML